MPTVDLATRFDVGAVILHSPLMSGMRVAFPNTKRTWFFDVFPSIDKVSKVQSPVLVIHGTDDEVIDFSHGISIYEKCPKAVEPLWVEVSGFLLVLHHFIDFIFSQLIWPPAFIWPKELLAEELLVDMEFFANTFFWPVIIRPMEYFFFTCLPIFFRYSNDSRLLS